jgi:hypothetical protein
MVPHCEFGTRFIGRDEAEIDAVIRVDRTRQGHAIACHRSQATQNPVLWRRLELLGAREWLRVLSTADQAGPEPPRRYPSKTHA